MVSLRLRYAASNVTALEYGYRGAWDHQQEGRPNYDFWRNFLQHSVGVLHASSNASVAATLPLDDRMRIAFDVDNLTNTRYLSSVDRLGPPATISLGLQIPLDRRATPCR